MVKEGGIVICSAVIFFFTALIVPLCFFMGYYSVYKEHCYPDQPDYVHYHPNTDYKLDRNNEDEANIYDSREYQISLPPDRYADRMKAVNDLLVLLRNYTGLELKTEDFETDIYEEVQYHSKTCGRSYSEFRRRKYYDSNRIVIENGTAVSINMDAYPKTYKKDALTHNLHPGAMYMNQSEEKIEQGSFVNIFFIFGNFSDFFCETDIHTAYYKFNRETKIKHLPGNFEVTTCGQAKEMFPYAFPNKSNIHDNTPLSLTAGAPIYYVWEYSISDHAFYGTTKIKFAWTLYFKQLGYCYDFTRKPMYESEFSMRVYSLGNGWADWDYDVLVYMGQLYKKLKNFY